MKYKAIGFDYSGVVHGFPSYIFEKKVAGFLNINVDDLKKAYFKNNHRTNIKNISKSELWRYIVTDLGLPSVHNDLMLFIDKLNSERVVNKDIISLIIKLKSLNYKVGLLSNYNNTLREKLKQQEIFSYFDAVGISSEMSVIKPKPEAFLKFCEMLDVNPGELIYIDDTQKSLETANAVGYKPILFRDFNSLEDKLKKLGII